MRHSRPPESERRGKGDEAEADERRLRRDEPSEIVPGVRPDVLRREHALSVAISRFEGRPIQLLVDDGDRDGAEGGAKGIIRPSLRICRRAAGSNHRRIRYHMPSTAPRVTRFGRMRMASPAHSPAAAAEGRRPRRTKYDAAAHAAAEGTSLITAVVIISTVGLVATSQAPISPASADPSRQPMPNVASTRMAALMGTIQNIACGPASRFAAAMSSGYPGAYTGTAVADPPSRASGR